MTKIKIYTTPACYFCVKAKDFFKKNNISYEEIDVSNDRKKAQELFEKTHQFAVPVIEIDGKFVIGFDEPKIKKLLNL